MSEVWKDVIDYEGLYEVSNEGLIRRNGKVLKPQVSHRGYFLVCLSKKSHQVRKSIHRLVAKSFKPCENPLLEVNHIDGNKLNNNISNLEWVTKSENLAHAYKIGLTPNQDGQNNHNSKGVIQLEKDGFGLIFFSKSQINRSRFHSSNVYLCLSGKYKKVKGFDASRFKAEDL